MAAKPKYLFHCTHGANLPSIAATGLDPKFSQGDILTSYAVTAGLILWARSHVAKRHGWVDPDIVLLRADVRGLRSYQVHPEGMYSLPDGVPPRWLAVSYGGGEWVPLTDFTPPPTAA
jgi:hypothetical protein